jgi:PTH2 family peptidyl-tRNA hydrolase
MGNDREFNYKMVIVVRMDLKLSPGKLAVQVAHAATTCAITASKDENRYFKLWFNEGQKKVVVKVPSEMELHELKETARSKGLIAHLIQDAGMTEIPAGTTTVLGIGPGPNAIVDSVTGRLPLL